MCGKLTVGVNLQLFNPNPNPSPPNLIGGGGKGGKWILIFAVEPSPLLEYCAEYFAPCLKSKFLAGEIMANYGTKRKYFIGLTTANKASQRIY